MTGKRFSGIAASPGVALGAAYLLDRRQVRVPRHHVEGQGVEAEVARLEAAVRTASEQLDELKTRYLGAAADHHEILEAHGMMLKDKALLRDTAQLIREEGINAEWAVSKAITSIRALFDQVPDAYLRERRGDVDFIGQRLLRTLRGEVSDLNDIARLDAGVVVIAHDLSPIDTALLARHKILAFVTEVGGKTSHTSIVARSLEIPAVVGCHGVFDAVGNSDMVLVDGTAGVMWLHPSVEQERWSKKRAQVLRREKLELLEAKALPAVTLDNHRITVAGNVELPHEVDAVVDHGGEAIGLYRTEFMFVGREVPPTADEHFLAYSQMISRMRDRPVTIRTMDLGGDKIVNGQTEPEANPALGLRGIRLSLSRADLFEPQISGLLRAATLGDVRILLPMISDVGELARSKELIADVAAKLRAQGISYNAHVSVGIMLEVPSAVFMARELALACDFFAIGTNDLVQYILAADRNNDRVDYLYRPLHPAVLRALKLVCEAAEAARIPVTLCGEMAGEEQNTPLLLALGLSQISMHAAAIPRIKRLVRELALSDCQELLADVLTLATDKQVHEMVSRFMATRA